MGGGKLYASLPLFPASASSEAPIRQELALVLSVSIEVFRPNFFLAIFATMDPPMELGRALDPSFQTYIYKPAPLSVCHTPLSCEVCRIPPPPTPPDHRPTLPSKERVLHAPMGVSHSSACEGSSSPTAFPCRY
jgi:hypothetical protein